MNRLHQHTCEQVKDKKVLVLCDTTEYNLNKHKGRIKDFKGLGSIDRNDIFGFFSHNQLVVNRLSNQTIGWADVQLFNRPMDNVPFVRRNSSLPIEKKESNKWLEPSLFTRDKILTQASHCLYVMDREADIYQVMSELPDQKCDFLIRARFKRYVLNNKKNRVRLKSDIELKPVKAKIFLEITGDNRKRKKRKATCEIRYDTYTIPRPRNVFDKSNYPDSIQVKAIHIKEVSQVPKGESAIEWLLWTSEEVKTSEDAMELISCYSARWTIEEAHRLLKLKGFNIESSELESGESIRKLLILGMEAAIKVMHLKAAREGQTKIKTIEIFEEQEIKFLNILNESLQGKTEKLSNPYPIEKLAWASWIIARLGGWKGYSSQRPPGTITMKRGLDKFYQQYQGYLLAQRI